MNRNIFREMESLRRYFDEMMDEYEVQRWPFSKASFLPARSSRAYPLFNIAEDDDAFYIEALTPGIDLDSLKISVVRNVLTIEGEKAPTSKDVPQEQYHRIERGAGKFIRTIQLTRDVDSESVEAEYRNGLLKITLPKREEDKPKRISVSVA